MVSMDGSPPRRTPPAARPTTTCAAPKSPCSPSGPGSKSTPFPDRDGCARSPIRYCPAAQPPLRHTLFRHPRPRKRKYVRREYGPAAASPRASCRADKFSLRAVRKAKLRSMCRHARRPTGPPLPTSGNGCGSEEGSRANRTRAGRILRGNVRRSSSIAPAACFPEPSAFFFRPALYRYVRSGCPAVSSDGTTPCCATRRANRQPYRNGPNRAPVATGRPLPCAALSDRARKTRCFRLPGKTAAKISESKR